MQKDLNIIELPVRLYNFLKKNYPDNFDSKKFPIKNPNNNWDMFSLGIADFRIIGSPVLVGLTKTKIGYTTRFWVMNSIIDVCSGRKELKGEPLSVKIKIRMNREFILEDGHSGSDFNSYIGVLKIIESFLFPK